MAKMPKLAIARAQLQQSQELDAAGLDQHRNSGPILLVEGESAEAEPLLKYCNAEIAIRLCPARSGTLF